MWNAAQHSYEELRDVLVDILLGREKVSSQFNQLGAISPAVAEVMGRRATTAGQSFDRHAQHHLHPNDDELLRDIFWDLFRQGYITPGLNNPNPNLPFFRLSHFGQKTLHTEGPYRFHDATSFLNLVKKEIHDISPTTIMYLDEAVAAFYADCMLATCVMLGVAAEHEFLRLIEEVTQSTKYGAAFAKFKRDTFIRMQITQFQTMLEPLKKNLPRDAIEDLDVNLNMIQSVLRIARNSAGHPSSKSPPVREQVYVFIQLFVPFARQLMILRRALA